MSRSKPRFAFTWSYVGFALILTGCLDDSLGPSIAGPDALPATSTSAATSDDPIQASELKVQRTNGGTIYPSVVGGIANGARVYVDRTYLYENVPALLQGQTYIQTGQSEQLVAGDDELLSFRIDRAAEVYVAYNGQSPPGWMGDFTATGQTLVVAKNVERLTFHIFVGTFPAGTVTLGSNQPGDARAMYTVILKPAAVVEGGGGGEGDGGRPVVAWDVTTESGRTLRSIEGGLENGARFYRDRDFTFDEVPDRLLGHTYLETAQSDQFSTDSDTFLSFRMNRRAEVYVAYNGQSPPGWMSDFTPTGETLVLAKNVERMTFHIFVKTFPAGTVTLGSNHEGDARANYTVILRPVEGARGPWAAVTTGWYHTCALNTDGEAYCWGYNRNRGQLGIGHYQDVLIPTRVLGGLTFTDITGGAYHTCAVATDGDGYCWGKNHFGQLGNRTLADSNEPVRVSGGLKFSMINAGEFHTCGLTIYGNAYCWGRNNRGQNGSDSSFADVFTAPQLVSGGHRWQAVTVGYNHSCGLTLVGVGYCWGQNRRGEIGDDSYADRRVPTPVAGGLLFASPVAEMSIEGSQHNTCAIGLTGLTHCWGDQWHNQLGTNDGRGDSPRPTTVVGVPAFDRVTVGGDHACALTPTGDAWCWGDNVRWAMARAEQLDYNRPQRVETDYRFVVLSGGWDHYCGVTLEGDIVCWGWNREGQIGDGTTTRRFNPVLLPFP